jgi:O-antigen/teichoic acid export membrane protein
MTFQKRRIGLNVIWNWLGVLVNIGAGFLVAPFLVHRLGDTGYGLWIFIASLTGYFGLLDLGIRGSVGRYLAYYLAQDDQSRMDRILSSALAMLLATGLVAATAVIACRGWLLQLVEVPPSLLDPARMALLVVGVNLGCMLVLSVFDATLWAYQRFDLSNAIDVPVAVFRVALIFYFVGHGYGLVALAWITLLATVVTGALKLGLTISVAPRLKATAADVTPAAIRTIFGYGLWNFVRVVGAMTRRALAAVVIGSWLGLAAVTPFALASSLVGYALALVVAAAGVLLPVATALHAQGRDREQGHLLLDGGRACLALGCVIVGTFVVLGPSFFSLWVGERLRIAGYLLAIMAVGELMPMSQLVTETMLLSASRHRSLATLSIVEAVVGVTLAVPAMKRFGLYGACVVLAVSATVFRGVGTLILGLRGSGIPWRSYVQDVLWPTGSALSVPFVGLAILAYLRRPAGWLELWLYGSLFLAGSGVAAAWLIGWDAIARGVRPVLERLSLVKSRRGA